MQPVNDDMDHLFRQAANNYPLNTQGADFDKLQQRMQAESDTAPTKKGRRRYFIWLLLLIIPLPFIFEHHYKRTATRNGQVAIQPVSIKDKADNQHSINRNIITAGDSISTGPAITNSTPAVDSTPANATTHQPRQLVNKQPALTIHHSKKGIENNQSSSEKALQSSEKTAPQKATVANIQSVPVWSKRKHRNKTDNGLADQAKDNLKHDIVVLKSGQQQMLSKSSLPSANRIGSSPKAIDSTNTNSVDNASPAAQQKDTTTTATTKTTAAKDSTTQKTTVPIKQLKETDKPGNYLYAGIVFGPDYSVVKSTRTGGTGYNSGVVAGYHFAKHWAVETGLLWNHKSYYSDGEYVSTEKLMLPIHTQVLHINGYCNLFEIPLNVQYHFSSKSKGHWFATTGLASYLMKTEEYYYLYKRYNTEYYGKTDYSNSTKNWFSVLQLGGGYQLKVGKQSSLRVEPYIKLPVAKIGIAQLPLSSTGLTIGYTIPL